ncbi:MAG: phosphatidylserine/phosphatidylglycerophosphate/cardiolipin synthase family protein, partial [Deltaproteobacteria bacterium]|nr:phosphatidylserine/phosphatidylglycerophosphate/cardiolipin synthase family protein [Deltaproteobacteria bacterium]
MSLDETYHHQFSTTKLDGLEVDFFIRKRDGSSVKIGTATTDAEGYATLYYQSDSGDSVINITHRLRSNRHGHATMTGKLYRLRPEQAVVAIDLDDLWRRGGFKEVKGIVQSIRKQGYQPILLVNTINTASTYEKVVKDLESLNLPVLYNDTRYSGFHRDHQGFGEAQLEKLKRLKFEAGVPIVAVYSRPVRNEEAYLHHGIKRLSWEANLDLEGRSLVESFEKFRRQVDHPDFDLETFLWDGLTNSRWETGNNFQFYFKGEEAFEALLAMIDHAKTFLSIRNASNIQDDAHGRELRRHLLEKARPDPQKQGPQIRMMMDGLLGNFAFASNPGFTWAPQQFVDSLKGMGVDYVTIPADHHIDHDEPLWGIVTRHHTKFTIADNGGRAVAYGGGRHFSSGSFDERIPPSEGGNLVEWLGGIEKGGFHDLSFTVEGPIVRTIHERFLDDFESSGGRPVGAEERKRLLSPDLYRSSSGSVESTPVRFIPHHSYQDQNCLNVLFRLLEDPKSKEVTFVNSFIPTEEMIEGMKLAARNGKEVRWVVGSIANIYDWIRDPRLEGLLRAGVKIYILPERFHTKLYGNSRYYAFGNHNLDSPSLRDEEDLTVVPKDSPAGRDLDRYVERLLAQATPLHVGWQQGEDLSQILERAYQLEKPSEEEISKEPKPHTFWELANHVALEGLEITQTAVSGVAREVAHGRFIPHLRGTITELDGQLGGGVDAGFGSIGERYVPKPKETWRTFFLSQHALNFGFYFYDQDFIGTMRYAGRAAPIQLHLGDFTPQISWDQYVGLTFVESLGNKFGIRLQSGNYVNLQGETLGARIGMLNGYEFLRPLPSFDPITIEPVVMNPGALTLTL